MSRRRVSVRDLGAVDCQGWLQRRKEGRGLLGSRWKKYWFILKKSSLYWYTDKTAEKAEGLIKLSDFTIEPARECRKKHALKASHPQVVTLFMAADSLTDMNRWISKLSAAAQSEASHVNTDECYSESSDQDSEECVSTSCLLDSEQETSDCRNGDVALPRCWSSPAHVPVHVPVLTPPTACSSRSSSRSGSLSGEPLSWLDLPTPPGAWGGEPPLFDAPQREQDKPSDEMERLYVHLKRASLSPIGRHKPSNQRDFRTSFIKRSQNEKINEKLHVVRMLNSTLKAKEAELLAVEQVLADPTLTALAYRDWRLSNFILLQDIRRRRAAAGGAAGLRDAAAASPSEAESSV